MKRLIVTADDFGRCLPINEAVEDAHRNGLLTAASLMVAGEAAGDAVERARRLPDLGVGLHLTLVDGLPAYRPEGIPDLLGTDRRLTTRLAAFGVAIRFRADVRRQVELEMRAQFERFRAFGLPLDHVDAHHHYHQHPTVLAMLLRLAREFGAKGLRVPWEPPISVRERAIAALSAPLISGMRKAAAVAGIAVNDRMFGLRDTGAMDATAVRRILAALPDGLSEIYFHPATRGWEDDPLPPSYRPVDEYKALIDPELVALARRDGIVLTNFTRDARPRS